VHGDQVAATDELVELQQVDVPGNTRLRRVEDHEHVVGVGVDPRDVVALGAGPHGQRMEAKDLREDLGGLGVATGDVHPGEPVRALQQGLEILDLVVLDPVSGHPAHIHRIHPRDHRPRPPGPPPW
jgi:hypothetical protein